MNIGEPKRTIEVVPVTLPIPTHIPMEEPVPAAPLPADEPAEPASVPAERASNTVART